MSQQDDGRTPHFGGEIVGGYVSCESWSLRWVGRAHAERRRRRQRICRLRLAVVDVLALALLVCGLADVLSTPTILRAGDVRSAVTESIPAGSALLVTETEDLLRLTISGPTADQPALGQLSSELESDHLRLYQAEEGPVAKNSSVASLDSCMSGAQQAVSDLEGGKEQAAIDVINSVTSPCESLVGRGLGRPVYPFDFPDPDVIDVAGTYFAYGTNSAVGNIQIITSRDLVNWKPVGNALPELPVWASPGYTWAPSVIEVDRSYLLYYAVADGSEECISVAAATEPEGPFVDGSTEPLVCQRSLGGSIDPSPYTDGSGNLYLTWKSNGGDDQPATIWAEELEASGMAMAAGSTPTELLQPSQPWEGSVVEAPDMWVSGGSYYLFYSGNGWDSASYAEGVAQCRGPLGPCSKPLDEPIYASQSDLAGPGGGSVFADSHGDLWIALDAWLPDAVGFPNARLLFLRRLTFSDGVPEVESPS